MFGILRMKESGIHKMYKITRASEIAELLEGGAQAPVPAALTDPATQDEPHNPMHAPTPSATSTSPGSAVTPDVETGSLEMSVLRSGETAGSDDRQVEV